MTDLKFLPKLKRERLSPTRAWKVDDDGSVWQSHNETDFTDCVAATTYEGLYMKQGMRSKTKHFPLNGGKSKLPKWQGHDGPKVDQE
jgi:hypothetical protein